jgi:hypothetical protein
MKDCKLYAVICLLKMLTISRYIAGMTVNILLLFLNIPLFLLVNSANSYRFSDESPEY